MRNNNKVNRRTVVAGAAVLAAASVAPRRTMGQGAARRARAFAPGARRVRGARRQCAHHGCRARRACERRRACARRRDRRGGRHCRGAGRRGHRRTRHDLHARLRRHPLAPVDQLPAADRARATIPSAATSRSPRGSARTTRRTTAIAACGSASPRRSAPASPRVHNWAHNVRSPAHADAEIAAMRDMGIRGRFAYGTPQGGANEQPMDLADLARVKRELAGTTPCCRSASARAMSAPTPIPCAATSRWRRRRRSGAGRATSGCRSRCIRRARAR